MSRFFPVLFAVFAPFFPLFCRAEGAECSIVADALHEASAIRQLPVKSPVPCLLQDKDQVRNYLLEIVEEQLPSEKLEYEEKVYKTLGLLPQDFAYKRGIIDLYLSQIGGYYDPERNRFVMADWLPAAMQTGVAIHELTHALQDQYYDLKTFIDPAINNGDTILARSALVEGDATAVMYDYGRKKLKQPGIGTEENIDKLLFANVAGSALSSGNIPKSLQMLLLFPYTSGLRFVHTILKADGYAGLAAAYKNPPMTTEEILHPEKYGAAQDYVVFSEGDLKNDLPSDYRAVYQDTLGEFGMTALLSMYIPGEAQKAAQGWGGDRVMLFADSGGNAKTVVWKSSWDTEKDLAEFAAAYHDALAARFKEASYNANGFITKSGEKWILQKGSRTLTVVVLLN